MNTNPVIYADLVRAAHDELVVAGVENVEVIADKIALQFCRLNAEKFYRVPLLKSLDMRKRDEAIRKDSEQMSVGKLSKKYDLKSRRIHAIISTPITACSGCES